MGRPKRMEVILGLTTDRVLEARNKIINDFSWPLSLVWRVARPQWSPFAFFSYQRFPLDGKTIVNRWVMKDQPRYRKCFISLVQVPSVSNTRQLWQANGEFFNRGLSVCGWPRLALVVAIFERGPWSRMGQARRGHVPLTRWLMGMKYTLSSSDFESHIWKEMTKIKG